jgi:hypothetical protein
MKIQKKEAGRPPVNIEEYFAKIQPYLQLGLSVNKACTQADIPHRTVYDYMEKDEDFRRRIEREQNDMVVRSRAKLKEAVDTKRNFSDEHRYVLDNLDKDFKKSTKVGIETDDGEKVTRLILDIGGE